MVQGEVEQSLQAGDALRGALFWQVGPNSCGHTLAVPQPCRGLHGRSMSAAVQPADVGQPDRFQHASEEPPACLLDHWPLQWDGPWGETEPRGPDSNLVRRVSR